jgi:hypothetical protein
MNRTMSHVAFIGVGAPRGCEGRHHGGPVVRAERPRKGMAARHPLRASAASRNARGATRGRRARAHRYRTGSRARPARGHSGALLSAHLLAVHPGRDGCDIDRGLPRPLSGGRGPNGSTAALRRARVQGAEPRVLVGPRSSCWSAHQESSTTSPEPGCPREGITGSEARAAWGTVFSARQGDRRRLHLRV